MRRHRLYPVRDLFALRDRMNRLFEEAAERRGRAGCDEGEIERADWIPSADIYEDEREYMLALDLPGIKRDSLDVSLDDATLTIRGERAAQDRKSTRLNSSHSQISYAVFCLKKKNSTTIIVQISTWSIQS